MTDKAMLDILSTFTQATDESKPLTEGKRTVTADTAMADILGKLQQLNESAQPVTEGKKEMKDSKEEMDEASCGSSMKKKSQMKESAIAEGVAQIEVRLTEAFKIFKEKPATSYSAPISSAGGSVKGSYGQSEKTPKVIAKPETSYSAPISSAGGSVKGSYGQGEKTPKVIAKPETPSSPLAKIGKSPKAADPKSSENPFAKYQGSGGSGADLMAKLQGSGGSGADLMAKLQGSGDPNADPFAKYQGKKDIKGSLRAKKSTKSPEEIFDIYREQIASLREQIASLREDPNEGNEFSGALAQAKKDGKDKFKVGDKEYDVKEDFDAGAPVGSKKKTKHGTLEKTDKGVKHTRDYKPDYLDLDGDGDKKEPMKKAAKDKKAKDKK